MINSSNLFTDRGIIDIILQSLSTTVKDVLVKGIIVLLIQVVTLL